MDTPLSKSMLLYRTITQLRLAAASVYDNATMAGLSEEDMDAKLAPFREHLSATIEKAAINDLPGCRFAIQMLEQSAAAHDELIAQMHKKRDDELAHANALRQELVKRMRAAGLKEHFEAGVMVTLTEVDGRTQLVLR